jgi:hypothetical protein
VPLGFRVVDRAEVELAAFVRFAVGHDRSGISAAAGVSTTGIAATRVPAAGIAATRVPTAGVPTASAGFASGVVRSPARDTAQANEQRERGEARVSAHRLEY